MSLNKLVYFAYEHALIQHGRRLTNAKIEAWEHGPVFREVYRSFKDYGDRPVTTRAKLYDPTSDSLKVVDPRLSSDDEKIIEEAVGPIAHLPASILRELSHASNSLGRPFGITLERIPFSLDHNRTN